MVAPPPPLVTVPQHYHPCSWQLMFFSGGRLTSMSSRAVPSSHVPSSHVEDEGSNGCMGGPEPKRPCMALQGDVNMPNAATPEYAAWAQWRNVAGSIAMSFMEAEDIGVMAANFQMRVMQQGVSVAGVDRMCQWAAPDMDQPTALAHMAMYEKAEPYVLDVAAGAWKRGTVQGQPSNGPGEHRGRKQEDQRQYKRPKEDLVHEEIHWLADRIRKLQMPKVPPPPCPWESGSGYNLPTSAGPGSGTSRRH